MKVGVAVSTAPDTAQALREVIREAMGRAGLERAEWAVCFFSMAHLPRGELIHREIPRATGCAALFGGSAAGLITAGREVEASPALALMVGSGGPRATSALLSEDGEGLAGLLAGGNGGAVPEVLFALPDAYRVDAAALLARLHSEHPRLPVYGAGATDNGVTGISLQLGLEAVRSRSVAALGFSGPLELAVGITQSCAPVGEPHFITAARDNVLLELDGRPAIYAYIDQGKALGLETFQQLVEELLLGFPLDSQSPAFGGESCLVRHLVGFDQEHGGLAVPQRLEGQSAMTFMHRNARTAEQDMRRMAEGLRSRLAGPPDFGFYFDCAARGSRLYGREGVDTAVIREALGEFPLIGMLGGFELATSAGLPLMYTYTGVLVLIRGRSS